MIETVAKRITWRFYEFRLSADTGPAAKSARAVCIFVNDQANRVCLEALAKLLRERTPSNG